MHSYKIIRTNRKSIAIQIKEYGHILVRCPKGMPANDVHTFVQSKSVWIERHLLELKSQNEPPLSESEIDQLRTKTKILVQERVAYYSTLIGVSCNRITVRSQRTRWGSCSSKGNLSFNCLLALVPSEVLDYVVVHELCHLKEMNHSQRFWNEVEEILPNYVQSKLWLKENGRKLIGRI